jgi:hypothetical protein
MLECVILIILYFNQGFFYGYQLVNDIYLNIGLMIYMYVKISDKLNRKKKINSI